MSMHMPLPSEPLAPSGAVSEKWARIDPIVYVTEARRAQARAVAEALGAFGGGLRRGLRGLTASIRRHIVQPLARRSGRRRAIAQLTALDARLLADIGLRRADIELAVDGLLADPRVTRRTPAPAAAVARPRADARRPIPAAPANTNRAAAPAQSDRIADLAA